MNITPAQENERTLAQLLGIGEEQAAQRLAQSVTISAYGDEAKKFAQELKDQLGRTIHVQPDGHDADLEVVIGGTPRGLAKKTLFVAITADAVTISRASAVTAPTPLHGVQRVIGTCYAAAVVLGELVEDLPQVSHAEPFVVRFAALGATFDVLSRPIRLSDTALAGAGAVGNAFLRAARHLDISGELHVCDPKAVGSGNPNRCLYFTEADKDKQKAPILCEHAQGDFPRVKLTSFVGTFQEFRQSREQSRVKRVIVGTDSRMVRRSIENELPLEVIDASTTGAIEVIVHSHGQPNAAASLGCIYPNISDELCRARDIALGLGVPLKAVTSGKLIEKDIADIIASKHEGLKPEELVGKAFDSLFRALCAEQTLLSQAGELMLTPFAFVSSFAGAMQALELARFESGARFNDGKNYFFASPWHPPHRHMRVQRPRLPECEVCGNAGYCEAMKLVWSDRVAP
jgi:hypothetical protein